MPLLRIFRPAAPLNWVSPLIAVSKGLVAVADCVPFPYVRTAFGAGLALLELIQMVGKSSEDLIYLAESVVAIMTLLRDEMRSHPTIESPNFRRVCTEFEVHLTQISKDLESMSRNWSSSKFRKYLNSQNIRDRIDQFTRQVNDLRANATFVAATGGRMDLASVADDVAIVKAGILELQLNLTNQRPSPEGPAPEHVLHDLAPYEKDFHALKLGDIHLEFNTARRTNFVERDLQSREKKSASWIDYKATVKGSIHTVRVYEGAGSTESWKEFLSFLADNSPSPHLPQLFGFCPSPRLRSLVFHGEFWTLDEYAKSLPNAEAIVAWELNVVSDVSQLWNRFCSLEFALVNPQAHGKVVISHTDRPSNFRLRESYSPFLQWLIAMFQIDHPAIDGPECKRPMADRLYSLESLGRGGRLYRTDPPLVNIFETLTSRGAVHHQDGGVLAKIPRRKITVDDSWSPRSFSHAYFPVGYNPEAAFHEQPDEETLDNLHCTLVERPKSSTTQFIVPLLGKSRRWIWRSADFQVRCGYLFDADIEFGRLVPDISDSWLAQASSIVPKSVFRTCTPDEFIVPNHTSLQLHWEMVVEHLPGTPEARAILNELPENIYVSVQVPLLREGSINEPEIYWSTDADTIQTDLIPPGALKIRMSWNIAMSMPRWELHHHEVAKKIQLDNGFDPTTTAAAEYLGLPLLDVVVDESVNADRASNNTPGDFPHSEGSANDAGSRKSDYDNWCRYYEKDPHTMEELVRYPYPGPPIRPELCA